MKYLLVLFLSQISFLALAHGRPEIIFDSVIEISSSDEISLGDLVSLRNPTQDLIQITEKYKIDQKTLADGLNPQSVRQIYKDLVTKFPAVAQDNPKLVVPQKIDLKTVTGFSEAFFIRKLNNYLAAQCEGCDVSVVDIKAGSIKTGSVPKIQWQDVKLSPSVLVAATVQDQVHWISVNVKIKKNVLVAKRNMIFNERISEEDFESRWMDVTFAKEEPVTIESLRDYKKTARPVMRGKAIFPADLKRDPAAERGKTVKIIIGDQDFEISSVGVAEDSGHVGDIIKVKYPDNKKILSAVIIEKGVVRVQ